MKRVVICSVLFVLAIVVSTYSHFKIVRVHEEMNARIDALMELLPDEDREKISKQSAELAGFWNEQEEILVHFTRHTHLDLVATGVARLPYLALYGDFGEFSAELSSIRRQMEHIHDSEILTLDNLM